MGAERHVSLATEPYRASVAARRQLVANFFSRSSMIQTAFVKPHPSQSFPVHQLRYYAGRQWCCSREGKARHESCHQDWKENAGSSLIEI